MSLIPELWSAVDRRAEEALARAIGAGDLLGALVAIEGADQATGEAVVAFVAERAARVRALVAGGAAPLDALIVALVQEAGLVGDGADYYSPDNSRVSRVVVRKTGQPILLASLWELVGRAAGLDVAGVGLPGHFVVRVGEPGVIVDVFQGGVPLDHDACVRIAARAVPGRAFEPAWLEPASLASVAARVLRNLVNACQQQDDEAGGYRAIRLLAGLMPDDAPLQLELARVTELFGAWPEAVAMYRDITGRFAGRREAQVAELKIVELEQQSRTLN